MWQAGEQTKYEPHITSDPKKRRECPAWKWEESHKALEQRILQATGWTQSPINPFHCQPALSFCSEHNVSLVSHNFITFYLLPSFLLRFSPSFHCTTVAGRGWVVYSIPCPSSSVWTAKTNTVYWRFQPPIVRSVVQEPSLPIHTVCPIEGVPTSEHTLSHWVLLLVK